MRETQQAARGGRLLRHAVCAARSPAIGTRAASNAGDSSEEACHDGAHVRPGQQKQRVFLFLLPSEAAWPAHSPSVGEAREAARTEERERRALIKAARARSVGEKRDVTRRFSKQKRARTSLSEQFSRSALTAALPAGRPSRPGSGFRSPSQMVADATPFPFFREVPLTIGQFRVRIPHPRILCRVAIGANVGQLLPSIRASEMRLSLTAPLRSPGLNHSRCARRTGREQVIRGAAAVAAEAALEGRAASRSSKQHQEWTASHSGWPRLPSAQRNSSAVLGAAAVHPIRPADHA
ncbi:hypothetical protein MTO96_020547 [Rhipicephalus appendiculatus]